MKIAAVVVTRNRLSLLKRLINSLYNQNKKFDEIIVVNNGSTDGTSEWLRNQESLTIINQGNEGSTGGQYSGIRYAHQKKYDWVWCSDDDISITDRNFLEKFINYEKKFPKGTLAISCRQKLEDGSVFIMSQKFSKKRKKIINIPYSAEDFLIPTEIISFAGVFFNLSIVEKVGLPRKELFISFDDAEYSARIQKVGLLFSCPKLEINHHLVFNKNTNIGFWGNRIYDETSKWRIFYHKRNYYIALLTFEKSFGVYLRIIYLSLRSLIYGVLFSKNKKEFINIQIKASYQAITNNLNNI